MKIAVIGATGHIGTFLVPRLIQEGHEIVSVSRARRQPYRDPGIWRFVQRVACDRDAEEAAGTFGRRIASLRADAVVDLICFTRQSAEHLVSHLDGMVGHYVC
jgi:nucleoside-diphosphate-sugar epimerase